MKLRRALFAVALALITAWRLYASASILGARLASLLALAPVAGALFAALYFAFGITDKRLNRAAYIVGLLLGCMWMTGRRMLEYGTFAPFDFAGWLTLALDALLCGLALGAATALLYAAAKAVADKPARESGRARRFFERGWFAWLALLACWTPVWLAFFPGTYAYDAPTQYYTYVDGFVTTNHPLLHTLIVSKLLDIGAEAGDMSQGIALYCALQMLAVSAILAYAYGWLGKKGAPLAARIALLALFALLPLYPLWSFSITKDVLFGAFILLMLLQLIDLWTDEAARCSPLRIACFVLSAALMMHTRNNGIYALALLAPFALALAKGWRIRLLALLAAAAALYLGGNACLKYAMDAESGDRVEIASIPLQQIARTASLSPESLTDDDIALLHEYYYDTWIADAYDEQIADPVKWAIDYESFEDDPVPLLRLWARLGLRQPRHYVDAFLEQNLPYYTPEASMRYNIVLGCESNELYPVLKGSALPGLRAPYEAYDRDFSIFGVPYSFLLSNTALAMWVCIALTGFFAYRRRSAPLAATIFLLALWITNLLGPVAIMRYMLGFFYLLPVLAAYAIARVPAPNNQPESKANRIG